MTNRIQKLLVAVIGLDPDASTWTWTALNHATQLNVYDLVNSVHMTNVNVSDATMFPGDMIKKCRKNM